MPRQFIIASKTHKSVTVYNTWCSSDFGILNPVFVNDW